MVIWKVFFSRNVILDENVILPNMVHGSIITQLSTIQPLLAPPQNNPHIYLVYLSIIPWSNIDFGSLLFGSIHGWV
jgi:hypothetical protein